MDEATRLGKPVMAHAHGAEGEAKRERERELKWINLGIKQAVRAGVRSIEHASFIDNEGIELMKERGTYLIPTLLIGAYYEDKKPDGALEKMINLHHQ